MKKSGSMLIGIVLVISLAATVATGKEKASMSGEAAQKKLMDGNRRFAEGKMLHPNQAAGHRSEIAKGQHPFAVIIGCSDSRVSPEVLFDQGMGDLFVIRVAGNVIDDVTIGSVEYAVEHLGVNYIMVLGHERCGAVDATVKCVEATGHLGRIVKAIQPAVEKAKSQPGDIVDNAVKMNVSMIVQKLKSSAPILDEAVKSRGLVISGAMYDLDEGIVTILP